MIKLCANWQQKVLTMLQGNNLQAQNLKQYPISNFEWTKRIYFGFWSFCDWKLFGICLPAGRQGI
jgi:hypothetical protein